MEHVEPLIRWPQPFLELAGFLASFLASGAVGFRFGVVARLSPPPTGDLGADELAARADGLLRAARLGLLGALVSAVLLAMRLPDLAARQHLTVAQLLATRPMVGAQVVLQALALLGFALASARWQPGWLLAAAGVVVAPLRGALFGQWARLVNPVHMLAGGLWIGTLAMVLLAGLASVFSGRLPAGRRAVVVAEMVAAFSPLALGSAAALAIFGVITAWNHLGRLDALWATPYGLALITKLGVVGVVLALGFVNWRRPRARLSTEAGVRTLRSTAIAEVAAAIVVLVITAVLVSLPSPPPAN